MRIRNVGLDSTGFLDGRESALFHTISSQLTVFEWPAVLTNYGIPKCLRGCQGQNQMTKKGTCKLEYSSAESNHSP